MTRHNYFKSAYMLVKQPVKIKFIDASMIVNIMIYLLIVTGKEGLVITVGVTSNNSKKNV